MTSDTINRQIASDLRSYEAVNWPSSFRFMTETDVRGGKEIFTQVMLNLIRNPNLTSSYLFRADVLYDSEPKAGPDPLGDSDLVERPVILRPRIEGFRRDRVILRRLIPRNPKLDRALEQTCAIFSRASEQGGETLMVYLPHAVTAEDIPWYHPQVSAVAIHYREAITNEDGSTRPPHLAIHFRDFRNLPGSADEVSRQRLERTAKHLQEIISKHMKGQDSGYSKRVHHDLIVPQARYQDRYTRLKAKYAPDLIARWVETTDPSKHVFEDLGIAAFLIELWADMYGAEVKSGSFPGFVDIGCGNGVLVYILTAEGYSGWGLDARARKTWEILGSETRARLKEMILVPKILGDEEFVGQDGICDGVFAPGTFIISNHADELTGWTPLLAAASSSPFLIIPCCSHNLAGDRYRHPPRKTAATRREDEGYGKTVAGNKSQYATLSAWVEELAQVVGFAVKKEYLRIPSTRNLGLVAKAGPSRQGLSVERVLGREGGGKGWLDNIRKLQAKTPRGH